MGCIGGEGLSNLQGQLAGGGQDQHLGVAGDAVDVGELSHAGEGGQREGRGLTGTGLRQTDHIAALKQQRDGLLLNGGRLLVADLFQSCQNAGVQAQVGKAHALFLGLFGGGVCGGFCGSLRRGFFCGGGLNGILSGHNGLCLGVQLSRGIGILSQFFLYTVGVDSARSSALTGCPLHGPATCIRRVCSADGFTAHTRPPPRTGRRGHSEGMRVTAGSGLEFLATQLGTRTLPHRKRAPGRAASERGTVNCAHIRRHVFLAWGLTRMAYQSVTADASGGFDQRSFREARARRGRNERGVSIGDGEYGALFEAAPPGVLGAHKTFIGGSRVYTVYRRAAQNTPKGAEHLMQRTTRSRAERAGANHNTASRRGARYRSCRRSRA